MHEAYEVSHLLNVTVQIEAIAAYGKTIMITLGGVFMLVNIKLFYDIVVILLLLYCFS